MKEHPILFSAPMVRAILSGQKTQTRRPVTAQTAIVNGSARVRPEVFARYPLDKAWVDQGPSPAGNRGPYLKVDSTHPDDDGAMVRLYSPWCAGDHLWVRETWAELLAVSPSTGEPLPITDGERLIEPPTSYVDARGNTRWHYDGTVIAYRANSDIEFCDGDGFRGEQANDEDMPRWRPSIHMPRWACRLVLVVTDVRPQRLHQITEEDALAEGVERFYDLFDGAPRKNEVQVFGTARDAFADLWADTYGRASWDANPWVWAVSFRRVV